LLRYLIGLILPFMVYSQTPIAIDGLFDDWLAVTTYVDDPANDEHDTDWYGRLPAPVSRQYSDVDILQVKFTHDDTALYGYVKSRGVIGRTSGTTAEGVRDGRFYFIITIDVDNDDATSYPLQEGNYWPNSTGYDMNMEVEFYNGSFNTGHYILHSFIGEQELAQGRAELAQHLIRLAPGNYDDYLQWVVFPDSTFTYVSDRGPAYENGIIKAAVSPDGHEAEMKAPMWGFFNRFDGEPVIQPGRVIDISFSLEGSGELSEGALALGYGGKKSLWGSDTAEPIQGYILSKQTTTVAEQAGRPDQWQLEQNFPNPFNASTQLVYYLPQASQVHLAVYNQQGRQVVLLKSGMESGGSHSVVWHATDESNDPVPSGVYFIRMVSNAQQRTIKSVLVR